jgi:AcrR family transcriptional regulator
MKKYVKAQMATQRRSIGRPRCEATRTQILTASLLLLESRPLQAITIEAIAKEAGVGKATIYRWWNSKALIVIDAFIEYHVLKTPMPRDLPPGDALAVHLRSLIREYAGWSGHIVAQILAEGQSDPAILRELRERFHHGRRAVVRETLEQWARTTQVRTPVDIEVLGELLYAPIYMRLLLRNAPLDEKFAREHIGYAYSLLGVAPPTFDRRTDDEQTLTSSKRSRLSLT